MKPEQLRRRAEICLRIAEACNEEAVATQLKLMASEFLMEAERIESAFKKAGDSEPEAEPQPA